MSFIIKYAFTAVVVFATGWLLNGVNVETFWVAVVVALVLALLNTIVKPILVVLTIPFTIITFGLFLLVINALIILLADYFIAGFEVDNFWWALLFSIIVSFFMSMFESSRRESR